MSYPRNDMDKQGEVPGNTCCFFKKNIPNSDNKRASGSTNSSIELQANSDVGSEESYDIVKTKLVCNVYFRISVGLCNESGL